MGARADIEKWKKAGKMLAEQLRARRDRLVAELEELDGALAALLGEPTTPARRTKTALRPPRPPRELPGPAPEKVDKVAEALRELRPFFQSLPAKYVPVVEARATGQTVGEIAAKQKLDLTYVSNTVFRSKQLLIAAREQSAKPKRREPSDGEDPEPAPPPPESPIEQGPSPPPGDVDSPAAGEPITDVYDFVAATAAPPVPRPPAIETKKREAVPLRTATAADLAALDETLAGRAHARAAAGVTEARTRSKTIPPRRLTRGEMRLSELALYPEGIHRPVERGDCEKDPGRPCPWVSCSHHLYLDVNPGTGAIKLNFPHLEVWEMGETCSLDVADRGGITLEEVGAIVNLTRERIRQVEVRGLEKIKRNTDGELGIYPDRPSSWPLDRA